MVHSLDILINDSSIPFALRNIAKKIEVKQRITFEEGVLLYEKAELGFLGVLANYIRHQKHEKKTYFNRNFHLEPTNLCIYDCAFCSYSRLIKQESEGWKLSIEQLLDKVKMYDAHPVTEVHIVGGVLPDYDLAFYLELFNKIRQHRPELHIKALTPVEYHYIFKKAKIDYATGMQLIQEAGVGSMPGGGAEIFHPEVRQQIAKGKCTTAQWFGIHRAWHQLGMRSNATMLYGHIEKYWHRIDHMERLRTFQDETNGFQAFIPLKFRNKNNKMSSITETSAIEDLRNYAIARIYLDNFDHIKAYWAMIGRRTAQLSLNFGVDDIDGTIQNTTKIFSMAGAEEQHPSMSLEELLAFIHQAGYRAIERDTLYEKLIEHPYTAGSIKRGFEVA